MSFEDLDRDGRRDPDERRADGGPSDNELVVAFTPRNLIVGFAIIAGLIGLLFRRRRGRR